MLFLMRIAGADIKKHARLLFIATLAGANFFIWYFAGANGGKGFLTIAFLNVGQGDAIYIEAPNGNQIIVDGGPDGSLVREIPKLMPFGDHSIDAIVVTNPDLDHFAGFLDLLKKYEVGEVIVPGTHSETSIYAAFEKEIERRKIKKITAERGKTLWLDEEAGVFLSFLFPDRDVANWSSNDGSIVAKLVYGKTSVILQGDSTSGVEHYLLSQKNSKVFLHSDILKAGHHGSRTSSSKEYVAAVSPNYAIISAGKENKYGHPHKETLGTLMSLGIQILKTFDGSIVFKSDGEKMTLLSM